MNKADKYIVCVATSIYITNRFLLSKHAMIPIFSYLLRCHLNDFIAGIIIIPSVNMVLEHSKYRQWKIESYLEAICFSTTCGLLWEYIFPLFYLRGTSDIWDMLAYNLGGFIYILLKRILGKK